MNESLTVLATTTLYMAVVHTVSGLDHYLPFLLLGRSEKWSVKKTMFYTLAGGVAHISSSVLIGVLGVVLGLSIGKTSWFASILGNFATWGLVILGIIYIFWGIWNAIFNNSHSHSHSHDYVHFMGIKISGDSGKKSALALILIFFLGPSEPFIPMLMLPASSMGVWSVVLIVSIFTIATLLTLICCVFFAHNGIKLFEFKMMQKYSHFFVGVAIASSGLMLMFLS